MFLAVTGTPGTGKSEVCGRLAGKGFEIIDLKSFLIERYLISKETSIPPYPVDPEEVAKLFEREARLRKMKVSKEWTIIDSHLSHMLPVDAVVLLRCDPKQLEERLAERGYSEEKARENVEAEMIDVIGIEVIDRRLPAVEIDTTNRSGEEVSVLIERYLERFPESGELRSPCSVDWLEKMAE